MNLLRSDLRGLGRSTRSCAPRGGAPTAGGTFASKALSFEIPYRRLVSETVLETLSQKNASDNFVSLRFESAADLLKLLGSAARAGRRLDRNDWRDRLGKFARHYDAVGVACLGASVSFMRPMLGAAPGGVAFYVDVMCPELDVRSAWMTFKVALEPAEVLRACNALDKEIRSGASRHHALPAMLFGEIAHRCIDRAMRRCCANCGGCANLRVCKGCALVRYCGRACQKADYCRHKAECARLQKVAVLGGKLDALEL